MPKLTFNNLSTDKKQRIFDAAVLEFSSKPFKDASINQIIKKAQIPKGSFYQYFEDKEDLYLYMMKRIEAEKRDIIEHAAINRDADIFEILTEQIKVSFQWAMLRPDYGRIGILMWRDDSEFLIKFRSKTIETLKKYIDRDKKSGLIKQEADSDLISDMLITLILNESFFAGLDEEKYFSKLKGVIEILKNGVTISCE
ncbi:TetR/AcrR family transcriptional regulator [Aminipila terrae]|uniref:TetR family transcriptional regulator n=1 Tax=Aminipila terrae TaxID=2697030 RepID=A0A6P1MF60_9FIRM|nr:TetR/AcrR family transcriptional regulator [Aminipila terrae]QHI73359.1 TetR family transcriptional regulator [Aminipila terrae]